eukprot:gene34292-44295_t
MEYDMTNEDVYMESLSEEDKIDEIIVFINRIYLRGERDGQLSTSVSLVKSAFELAGVSSTVFDNGLVCRAKKGGRRSTEEARECSAGGAKREKFPMPLDIILDSKSSFWVQGKWDKEGLDRKAVWLGIAIGFDSGLRVGNYTMAEGVQEDHGIRAGQLTFVVMDHLEGQFLVPGGEKLRDALQDKGKNEREVSAVMMNFSSNKTSNKSRGEVLEPKYISRRNEMEGALLDCLVSWIMMSGVLEDDGLFTRYGDDGKMRQLRRRDVNEGIKEICESRGLDSNHFFSKSLRKGFVNAANMCGVSERDRNARGGWVRDSQVPDRVYGLSLRSEGAFAFSEGNERGVELEDLRLLAPAKGRSRLQPSA